MEYLDLTPWRCPEPLIRLKLWLREAQPGQVVTIRLADPGSRQDIPAYLQRLGHQVTLQQAPDQTLSLLLVVGAWPLSQTPSCKDARC
ncbi:sulfurtransferase TusA family protein [Aeromonas enteropelogenes]|uniref:sulfurtransferase TusA family protein n=1 Tax=Aeromonas enteropelogenes TaxID=29489 RepID=UPI0038D160D0